MRVRVRYAPLGGHGITEAGWVVDKPPIFPVRRFHAWCLVLVTAGGGRHEGPDGPAPVAAGDLIVVVPGEPHRYGRDAAGTWSEVFLTMAGPVADALGRTLLLPPAGRIRRAVPAAFRRGFQDLADRFLSADGDPGPRLLAELHGLLAAGLEPASPADGWLARAQAVLARDLHRPLALAAAARELGLPERTLRSRFRAACGQSPMQYRLHRRLAEARRRIAEEPDLPLAAVAEATGFCSPFQLSRIYRAHLGHPPSRDRG
jgi:AraC family transcriptional regulator of arabinose operon